jgi:AraC-like DNA-binding protein
MDFVEASIRCSNNYAPGTGCVPPAGQLFDDRPVRPLGGLSCARWRNSPPEVIRSVVSAAKVRAIAHAGFAAHGGPQEAHVPALPTDLLIVLDRPVDVRAKIGDCRVRFEAGRHTAVYMAAGRASHWVSDRGSRAAVLQVHIPLEFRERVLSGQRNSSTVVTFGPRDAAVQMAQHLREALVGGHSLSSLSIESYAALFVEGWASAKIQYLPSALTRWQLYRVVELMRARLAEAISLEECAAVANLSLSHFARSFTKTTGVSPHRFLVQLRLERTKELLQNTNLRIGDIAAETGFSDPGYLARVFRKELGVTPAIYRRDIASRLRQTSPSASLEGM